MSKIAEIILVITKDERYKNFTLLAEAVAFKDKFYAEQYIPLVQIHDTTIAGDTIVGFAGAFAWKDGKITALDGDTYFRDMKVIGYKWFERDGDKCLDILVEDW